MRRTLSLCIISIFLSAAFSGRAFAQQDYLLKAAQWERVVYEAESPVQANHALFEKAECYKQAGRYADALSTLGRIRMYAASPELRRDVLVQKALDSYLAGDYDASLAFLSELGVAVEYKEPRLKKENATMLLTLLVPAGYLYLGEPLEGALSTLLNAGSIAWIVSQVMSGCYVSGILGGAVAMYTTFTGAQERTMTLMAQKNATAVSEAKRAAASKALSAVLD